MFKWLEAFANIGQSFIPPDSYFRNADIKRYAAIAMEALLIHEGTKLSAQEIVDKAHGIAVLMVDKKID